jgi:hypothetical protein
MFEWLWLLVWSSTVFDPDEGTNADDAIVPFGSAARAGLTDGRID